MRLRSSTSERTLSASSCLIFSCMQVGQVVQAFSPLVGIVNSDEVYSPCFSQVRFSACNETNNLEKSIKVNILTVNFIFVLFTEVCVFFFYFNLFVLRYVTD